MDHTCKHGYWGNPQEDHKCNTTPALKKNQVQHQPGQFSETQLKTK